MKTKIENKTFASNSKRPIDKEVKHPVVTSDISAYRTPVEVLRQFFVERKNTNAHYSLNAFARDLGISASHLSRILSGSRALTLKQGMHIAALLGFDSNETNLFVLGIVEKATPHSKISKRVRERIRSEISSHNSTVRQSSQFYVNYDIERFKTISHWYHLGILNLTYVEGFSPDPQWIAYRLGISSSEAQEAVSRLKELGFLEETETGSLKKINANLYFKTQRSEVAIRSFHKQMIDKAKDQLNKTADEDFQKRLVNSITFACALEHVPLLKKKINEFQDEVLSAVSSGNYQEVYQLNCQLFPLTKNEK